MLRALLCIAALLCPAGLLHGDEVARFEVPDQAEPTTVINLYVRAGYAEREVAPSERCTDAEFVRRVHLDLVGRIPKLEETKAFLAQTESSKRDDLIEQLVDSDEFAIHFAQCFDTLLMGRKEKKLSQRKKHGWHDYLETVFRENRPWNSVAREILLARATPAKERGHLWFLYERDNKHEEIAEAISRGFFGVDIACAQCHDHPLAFEIEQAHYWGLVAFFKRSKNENAANGLAIAESAIGGFDSYANALTGSTEEVSLTFLESDPVPEAKPEKPDKQEDKDELYVTVENEPRVPKFSRREKFVDEVLANHPRLANAMVNRVWALLIGRGIVHPIDEMDSEHPPSHPQLLEWLADDFRDHDYDVKRLVSAIVRSQPYQLGPRDSNSDAQPASFAFAIEKPLSAEVTLRSLHVAFAIEHNEGELDKDIAVEFRRQFPDVVAENELTNLKQAMSLSNHPALNRWTQQAAKQLPKTMSPNDIDQLFQRLYCRSPKQEEIQAVQSYLAERTDRPREAIAELLWALVTSAEFRFNH